MDAQSTENIPSAATGLKLTNLLSVLEKAWLGGFMTKSNFAREKADEIATASSLGLITTHTGPNAFQRSWVVTPQGLQLLWNQRSFNEN